MVIFKKRFDFFRGYKTDRENGPFFCFWLVEEGGILRQKGVLCRFAKVPLAILATEKGSFLSLTNLFSKCFSLSF